MGKRKITDIFIERKIKNKQTHWMLHPRRNEKVEMGTTWKCKLGCIYYKYIPGVYLPSDNNEMQSLRFLPGRNRPTPPLVGKRTVKDVETDVKLPSPAGGTRVT